MWDQEITMENNPNLNTMNSTARIQDALEMAVQGIVLTKNQNGALPIETLPERKILITGPTAHSLIFQSGGWTWQWQGVLPATNNRSSWFTYGTTVYQALASAVKSGGSTKSDQLVFSCGVDIRGGECQDDPNVSFTSDAGSLVEKFEDWLGLGEPETSIQRAVDQAKGSDVVIVCVGEEAYAEKPGDIRSMYLPQGQQDLVRALKKANHKIVLVYFGGRPRLLGDMAVRLCDCRNEI
jgi:beta-glucosidase